MLTWGGVRRNGCMLGVGRWSVVAARGEWGRSCGWFACQVTCWVEMAGGMQREMLSAWLVERWVAWRGFLVHMHFQHEACRKGCGIFAGKGFGVGYVGGGGYGLTCHQI